MSNIISRDDWVERYAAHFAQRAGVGVTFARDAALVALAAGQHKDHATPEQAADEELSWTDNEGAID